MPRETETKKKQGFFATYYWWHFDWGVVPAPLPPSSYAYGDQIANKPSSFVILNVSILVKYREKRLCDLQVYSNLSSCNYRIFVKKILLEIGFIGSIWPATRLHYLLNFGSEKKGPLTIKLANT